jgi:hypothetical protein
MRGCPHMLVKEDAIFAVLFGAVLSLIWSLFDAYKAGLKLNRARSE